MKRATPRLPTWMLALVVPVVAVVVAVVTLNVTTEESGRAGVATSGVEVIIKNFAFSPTPLRVKADATVTVLNDDGTDHTLTADDGTFDTGTLDGSSHATIMIGKPGKYAYHCDIHPYMTGVIEAT